MALVPDVMIGVSEVLRLLTGPGDAVVVNSPVYPPFFEFVSHLGRRVVEAPLSPAGRIDPDTLEHALGEAARSGDHAAYLICNPQNPTGTVHTEAELTEALASDRVENFRDVIAHYVREHNVPEVDVAAALAVVLQGEEPMLLEPEKEPRGEKFREERPARRRDDEGPRDGFTRERRPRPTGDLVPWRVAVGRRQRITPRQIVGALANEGGLSSDQMGRINIRPDHSIIELPADLPREVLDRLSRTRVSGKLIELRPDDGPRFTRERPTRRSDRAARDDYKADFKADKKFKKPRHKG